ncbi:unnamed protein product [Hermetia illucens]|uniref:C2H2-type domain-containing protein n=1 Tax=Hermetia illucens TaxID=343691 RepID=A0A7R8UY13_HERIL|nr:zinc finger protein 277 [Hermetia illucens]CAD7089082.1 unnamed protein product [Hermetia illucens]
MSLEKLLDNEIETNILSSLTLSSKIEVPRDDSDQVQCVKCKEQFEFPEGQDDYLAHIYLEHRLVIADVDDIADLKGYLEHWQKAFQDHELEEYCTTMLLDQLPDGTPSKNERYYLLSDILPQDFELRKTLHATRLENALVQHQFELTDRNFCRECLYCRTVIKGLRSEFLEHLFNKHFLQLGKPENLVYIDELIDVVQSKLENLICLFCEKIFKDRATLKEHMRKKGHKRINPDIRFFDRFFLVNYKLEKPKHVKNIKKPRKRSQNSNRQRVEAVNSPNNQNSKKHNDDAEENNAIINGEDSESDWSDWDGDKQNLTCLFCSTSDVDFTKVKSHMILCHGFDFEKELKPLNFYQKIKIVNYIRRQMHVLRCVTCNNRFESAEKLSHHLETDKHFGIGEKKQWDQPEFFFPTYEDDGILCHLEDNVDCADYEDSGVVILSEDCNVAINKDAEQLSLENFVL